MNHSASRSVKLGQLGKLWSLLGTFGIFWHFGNHLACQEMDMEDIEDISAVLGFF